MTVARTQTPGEMRHMMARVNELLGDQEVLQTLGVAGGANPDERNPTKMLAHALSLVKDVLSQELQIEQEGPDRHYSPRVLQAISAESMNTSAGRTLIRVEALAAGRNPERLALERAMDPNDLIPQKKIEQFRSLAMAGRFDQVDPQFRDDRSFRPYGDRWQDLNPETQQGILDDQRDWGKLAKYYGQVVSGEMPDGPAPVDRWGVKELVRPRVDEAAAAELVAMRDDLQSGRGSVKRMEQHLRKIDNFTELLGAGWEEKHLDAAFGKEAGAVRDWLRFRHQFVEGKKAYWHRVIEEGKPSADDWDKQHYQPLRERRDQSIGDPTYGGLVQAIQNEAVEVHNTYADLHAAKQGWWQDQMQAGPAGSWEQQASGARSRLAQTDPGEEALWNPDHPWELDKANGAISSRFAQAYEQSWRALLRTDGGALAQTWNQLKDLPVSLESASAKEIRTRYEPQLQEAYLGAQRTLIGAGGDRGAAQAQVDFWRQHVDQVLIRKWDQQLSAERPLGRGAARTAAELEAKFQVVGWSSMVPHAGLIWEVSQETGLQAEILAAKIMQESSGNARADAGRWAGKGLMQIEFKAHYSAIPGGTEQEKLNWVFNSENNVRFGAQILKGHLDQWIAKYGPDEGLKRGLQYWNYGSGAAAWVEKHSTSSADWQYWVDKYHDTRKYNAADGTWYQVAAGGNYGTPRHWERTYRKYDALMNAAVEAYPARPVPPPETGERLIYDGWTPASGTTSTSMGWPSTPPFTNSAGDRSVANYSNVINQFAVANNRRFLPRDGYTYCNIFAWDVTRAMGAEIPHWVTADGRPTGVGQGRELNANATDQWLAKHGANYGWHRVSAAEAQTLANQGKPAVAVWNSGSGSPGHVAMVRPGTYDPAEGPTIAQAGGQNYNLTTVRVGFGRSRMDQIAYYAHD